MKVHVKLHAVLRDLLPEGIGEVTVDEEASVAALLDSLKIDPELRELVTVNGVQVQDLETRLNDGDAVQVFPAVAGG